MAITTTPLGFQKPDGNESIRNGDNVISANADRAESEHQGARGRLGAIEAKNTVQDGRLNAAETKNVAQDGALATHAARLANLDNAAGFTGDPLELNDAAVAQTLTTGTSSQAALDNRLAIQVPPLVADAISNDPTVAAEAAALAQSDAGLVRTEDDRLPALYTDEDTAFRVRDSARRVALEVNAAGDTVIGSTITREAPADYPTALRIMDTAGKIALEVNRAGETVIGSTVTRESSPDHPTALRVMDIEGNIAFEVDAAGDVYGIPDTTIRTQLVNDEGASSLTKVGVVLAPGAAGQFDAGMVESPCIYLDPVSGRQAMIYTAYSTTDGAAVASHGKAYSDDGVNWTRVGQDFAASGIPGSPDEKGVTGPVVLFEGGTEHRFYIGLTEVGYEAGEKTLCHASRPIGGTWTRHGAIIAAAGTGWYSVHIWHPNFVYFKGTWYCFFNATGNGAKERMGWASSSSLYGPWEVNPEPMMPDPAGSDYSIVSGDGFVWLEDGMFRMDFFRAAGDYSTGYEVWATTTMDEFPFGWVERGTALAPTPGTYDGKFAHKPWITRREGRIFHYYTAVDAADVRSIALAVTGGPLEVRKPAAPITIPAGATDAQKLALIADYLTAQGVLVQGT